MISARKHQFAYFDTQLGHPDWANKTVLDFGGNVGNMLLDPNCTIRPERYWSLDVTKEALEEGQRLHPDAHFVHYDRYNFEYNPSGVSRLPIPDLGRRFDIIVAYSVFTHTSQAEMLELVERLRSMLTDDGVLAFTFIDPYFDPPADWPDPDGMPGRANLRWRLERSHGINSALDVDTLMAEAGEHPLTWATLVNHEQLVIGAYRDWIGQGDERSQYLTFCTEEYMRWLYPDGEILPPAKPQRQSCCVLRRVREREEEPEEGAITLNAPATVAARSARRDGATWISTRTGQFRYFDDELGHPDWAAATVLDFGGNVGNILLDPACTIRPERYWCLDVVRDAIEQGQRRFPEAHFVHYDRYNFQFNPTGSMSLPIPRLGGQRFDVILAQSVFTHTSQFEMRGIVEQLRAMLAPDGMLAFTFIDPYFTPAPGAVRADEQPGLSNLEFRLAQNCAANPDADLATLLAKAAGVRLTWATLVNNEDLVVEPSFDWVGVGDERAQYLTFCTEEHMRTIFPDARVLPPVPPERFSCCVVRPRPGAIMPEAMPLPRMGE